MSTSRSAYLVYGFRVPRNHAVFGDDYPDEWLEGHRNKAIYGDWFALRAFGDAECSDDALIGIALVEVDDFSRGQDFAPVTKLEPEPKAKADIARIGALFGPDVAVGLFVCGETH
jgi:hypothetical protein